MIRQPHLEYEKASWLKGEAACGIDEVGRGSIAGPVVAAAVIFDSSHKPSEKIRDSKTLSEKQRQEIFDFIVSESADFGVGLVSAAEIDEIGIVPATKRAMALALEMLSRRPDVLLIDAVNLEEVDIRQESMIKGDAICYSISAASVLAKVYRDRVVAGLDNVYRGYGFAGHKGYGAATHYEAIRANGLTPEHRKSFLRKLNF